MQSIAAACFSLSLGSSTVVGSASKNIFVDPDEAELPYPDAPKREIDQSVRELGPMYPALVAEEEAILSFIDNSQLKGQELRETREFLVELWDTHNVVKEKDGSTTRYVLEENRMFTQSGDLGVETDDYSKSESELIQDAHQAITLDSNSSDQSQGSGIFDALWEPSPNGEPDDQGHHEPMVSAALNDLGMDDKQAFGEYSVLIDNADQPDLMDCECEPDVEDYPSWMPAKEEVQSELEDKFNLLFHMVTHAWSVEGVDLFTIDTPVGNKTLSLGKMGKAPSRGQEFYSKALSSTGRKKQEYLGKALHILQDVGMPLHSGAFVEQLSPNASLKQPVPPKVKFDLAPKKDMHYAAEHYAARHFGGVPGKEISDYPNQDDKFKQEFKGSVEYGVSNMNQAIKDLAETAHQYSTELFYNKLNAGYSKKKNWKYWNNETAADKILANVHSEMGRYTRGVIDMHYGEGSSGGGSCPPDDFACVFGE